MEKKQKTLAVAGAGIAALAAFAVAGPNLANAAAIGTSTAAYGQSAPAATDGTDGADGTATDGDRPARPESGTLTADAASKAVAAAAEEVEGGTVTGVRAWADGTYAVHVETDEGTHSHVLLDSDFAVSSVEEGGQRGPGGHGRGMRGGPPADAPEKGADGSTSTPTPSTSSAT